MMNIGEQGGRVRKRSERKRANRRTRALHGNTVRGTLRFSSWNMMIWTEDRMKQAMEEGADIMALQETKLAKIPLEKAKKACGIHRW